MTAAAHDDPYPTVIGAGRSRLASLLSIDDVAAYRRVSPRWGYEQRAAGNGSLMRTMPAAIFFARAGTQATVDTARRISDLTHGDPSAGDGCAIYHRLVAVALDGGDPLGELVAALEDIPADRRGKWEHVLAPGWTPEDATEPNGAVWPTLGTAVWALRHGWPYAEAMRHVIDVGGDTDTIAAVAGGLLGAVQASRRSRLVGRHL